MPGPRSRTRLWRLVGSRDTTAFVYGPPMNFCDAAGPRWVTTDVAPRGELKEHVSMTTPDVRACRWSKIKYTEGDVMVMFRKTAVVALLAWEAFGAAVGVGQ